MARRKRDAVPEEQPRWLKLLLCGEPPPFIGWCIPCRSVVPQVWIAPARLDVGLRAALSCGVCKHAFWKPTPWPCVRMEQLDLPVKETA